MSSGHLGLAQGGCLYDTQKPEVREAFYRQLYLLRRVEERIADIYPTDKIKSPVHLAYQQAFRGPF
jgi:TPP-dependent pyruvate/acetoin dehydrogenase alpha subunit